MTSRMERTMAYAKRRAWKPWIVERWIQRAQQRYDMFNIIDVFVLDGKPGALGIQVCGEDLAAHRTKILESEYTVPWLAAGLRLEIWSWVKRKARRQDGSYALAYVWKLRIEEVKADEEALEEYRRERAAELAELERPDSPHSHATLTVAARSGHGTEWRHR